MGMASLEPMREELRSIEEIERREIERKTPPTDEQYEAAMAADRMLPINPLEPLAKEDLDRIQQSVVVFPTGRGKVAAVKQIGGPELAMALMAGAQLPMPADRLKPDETVSHRKPSSAERRAMKFATGWLRLCDGKIVGGESC